MSRQEYAELLSFKEERVNYWEEYGCVLSKDGRICEFMNPEVGV